MDDAADLEVIARGFELIDQEQSDSKVQNNRAAGNPPVVISALEFNPASNQFTSIPMNFTLDALQNPYEGLLMSDEKK